MWRNDRIDESTTHDDFCSGPLRGIFAWFRRVDVLQNVQTLILDGQSAPADILHEIISNQTFRVRILSVIGSQNLHEDKFQQVLKYAVRPNRPKGMPVLKGVYIFGSRARPTLENYEMSPTSSITGSLGDQL